MNCRDQIIYATLLHDVGKFMQRAELPCAGLTDDVTKQRVCPQDKRTGRFTHLHCPSLGGLKPSPLGDGFSGFSVRCGSVCG